MRGIVNWFANNGVAANLLMAIIMIGGCATIPHIKKEVFPEMTPDIVVVSVPFPGSTPEEVEEGINLRLEEAIDGIVGIKKLSTTATEGMGVLVAELETDADAQRALDRIKQSVDNITTFPEEAEEPNVRQIDIRRQVINVAVSGDTDETTLKLLVEKVRSEVLALDGITQVQIANAKPYEIAIEVSERTLQQHGLTFDRFEQAIRSSSLDLPGGTIKTVGGDILIRTKGQGYKGSDFEAIPLLTRRDGSRVTVGDVAFVHDAFADIDRYSFFDGKPTILLQVFRTGQQSALAVSASVKEYVEQARHRMPEGITLTTWQDEARILNDRLELLLRNGAYGLILVFLVLSLFLRLKLAFWVAIGIPVSFLGCLFLLPGFDVSINLLSLFAFILALGIVVDDAIIVSENIYRHHAMDKSPIQASVDGAMQVIVPVTLAVATTAAAFWPMMDLPGFMGEVAGAIPIVVIVCLAFSLVESQLILPHHLKNVKTTVTHIPRGPYGWYLKVQTSFDRGLQKFIFGPYKRFLGVCLRWRYATLGVGLAGLVFTVAMLGAGWIRFEFFPPVEADNVVADITFPEGTPVSVTEDAVRKLEESANKLRKLVEKDNPKVVQHMLTSVGGQPFLAEQRQNAGALVGEVNAPQLGEVNIALYPPEIRNISSQWMKQKWQELTPDIPDVIELTFTANLISSGKPIDIQLHSNDLVALRAAAEEVKERLRGFDQKVLEISDTFRAGKPELKLNIKPQAEALGLTLADLARQVRQGFYGGEAQRLQRGRDEVKVMVRYPAEERKSLTDIERMRVRLPNGVEVPFTSVATIDYDRGSAVIQRTDRNRTINVTAEVDRAKITANEVFANLRKGFFPDLRKKYPNVRITAEGEQREQTDMVDHIIRGIMMSMLVIFGMLAVAFRSYIQPAIVMFAIPFGAAGAILAHFFLGMDLSIMSLIGVMALIGVVVNDSLVMIDFINQRRRDGVEVRQAIEESGPLRFRPILLTSLTTFAGLTPMLLERSLQAKFLIPMAVSLAFGVLFATVIILVLVPAAYLALEDIRGLFLRKKPT